MIAGAAKSNKHVKIGTAALHLLHPAALGPGTRSTVVMEKAESNFSPHPIMMKNVKSKVVLRRDVNVVVLAGSNPSLISPFEYFKHHFQTFEL